jgi:hypothetical protein
LYLLAGVVGHILPMTGVMIGMIVVLGMTRGTGKTATEDITEIADISIEHISTDRTSTDTRRTWNGFVLFYKWLLRQYFFHINT